MSRTNQLVARFQEAGHPLSALLLPAMAGTPVRNGQRWAWPNLDRFTVRECLALDIGSPRKDGTMAVRSALFRAAIALKALVAQTSSAFKDEEQLTQELPELLQAVRDLVRPIADRPCWEFCVKAPNGQDLFRPFQVPQTGEQASIPVDGGVLHVSVQRQPVPVGGTEGPLLDITAWLAASPGASPSFVMEAVGVQPGREFPRASGVWGLATCSKLGLQAADTLMSLQNWYGPDVLAPADEGSRALLHIRRLEVSAPCRGKQQAQALMPLVAQLLEKLGFSPSVVSLAARPLQFDQVWVEKAPAQVRLRYQDACEALQVLFSGWNWSAWFPRVDSPVLFAPHDRRASGSGDSQGELLTQLMTPLWQAQSRR